MVLLCHGVEVHLRDSVRFHISPARGIDAAVFNAELAVGHDKLRVNEHLNSEPRAGRAGAVGIVEGKQARGNLLQRDSAVRTGVVLGKAELLLGVLQFRRQQASGEAQRCFGRIRETAADAVLDGNAVDDDLDGMLFVLVQRDIFRQVIDQAVHTGPNIAGTLCIFKDFLMLAFFAAHHRRQQGELCSLRKLHQAVDDLVHGLLADLTPALWAVRNPDTRVQKAEIVIDLRHRSHSGTGIL